MFPNTYNCLKINEYSDSQYSISPIKFEDYLPIMKWRNNQIELLRQKEPLNENTQIEYFKNVISKTFEEKKPSQLLFRILLNKTFIGYGGLVHIDWKNYNSEISFLLDDTKNSIEFYIESFTFFLNLIEKIAVELKMHKIYTCGYNVAEYRFTPLIKAEFEKELVLKNHILFNNNYVDLIYYSKFL